MIKTNLTQRFSLVGNDSERAVPTPTSKMDSNLFSTLDKEEPQEKEETDSPLFGASPSKEPTFPSEEKKGEIVEEEP